MTSLVGVESLKEQMTPFTQKDYIAEPFIYRQHTKPKKFQERQRADSYIDRDAKELTKLSRGQFQVGSKGHMRNFSS